MDNLSLTAEELLGVDLTLLGSHSRQLTMDEVVCEISLRKMAKRGSPTRIKGTTLLHVLKLIEIY
jgi:hypothetical protein